MDYHKGLLDEMLSEFQHPSRELISQFTKLIKRAPLPENLREVSLTAKVNELENELHVLRRACVEFHKKSRASLPAWAWEAIIIASQKASQQDNGK